MYERPIDGEVSIHRDNGKRQDGRGSAANIEYRIGRIYIFVISILPTSRSPAANINRKCHTHWHQRNDDVSHGKAAEEDVGGASHLRKFDEADEKQAVADDGHHLHHKNQESVEIGYVFIDRTGHFLIENVQIFQRLLLQSRSVR